MALEKTHEFWLCPCCLQAAVNGEFCDDRDGHAEDIEQGLNKLSELGHLVPDFDTETGEGHENFSWDGCDCCSENAYKGGELHRFAILGEAS